MCAKPSVRDVEGAGEDFRRMAAALGTRCWVFFSPLSLLSSGIVGSHELRLRSLSPRYKSRPWGCAYRGQRGTGRGAGAGGGVVSDT